jgi:hypothetical protein
MKSLKAFAVCLCALMVLMCGDCAMAQAESVRFGAAGIGYTATATPNIQGFAALGIPITEKIISYTAYEVYPVQSGGNLMVAGYHLQYDIGTGAAYKLYQFTNSWSLWGLGKAGLTTSAESTKAMIEYGGFVDKGIGKGWGIMFIMSAKYDADNGNVFNPRFGIRKRF